MTLDLAPVDGLLLIIALPLAAMLVLLLSSPLSFFMYRLMSNRSPKSASPDASRIAD